MAEEPDPEQIVLMKRVVELAEQQTALAAKRTEQSAERSEQSAERSYMNAERTLSVWTRTALSLMIFGIAVDRFGLLLRHEPWSHAGSPMLPNPLSTLGGVILVALGVFVVAASGVRYLLYARAWRKAHAWPPRHAPYLAFAFAVLVALFGIALLVPATRTIVHVPAGTLVEVPSLGLASLAQAASAGGDDLVQHSIENLIGVRFGDVLHLAPADLIAQLDRTGPLSVSLDDPVEDRTPDSRVTVVFPAGAQTVDAGSVLPFLQLTGSGSSLQRLVRHQAFWNAYLAAVDDADAPVPAVAALAGKEVRQRVLPVEAVAGTEGGEELYRVIDKDLASLVERVFPDSGGPAVSRPRVRILNGAGAPGIAQQVQPLLVETGAEVTLSGNADRFDYATTQIVYYDDAHLEDARTIREALGVGEVVKSLTELAVVDVTVVVGADFLAAHPGG
jgi:uncharacterized membrane protein YidH (DUF202 family)